MPAPLLLRQPPPPHLQGLPGAPSAPDPLPCLGLEGRQTSAVPLPLACSDDSVLFPQMTQDRQTVKQLLCPFQAYLPVALPPGQAVLLNGGHRPLVLQQQPSAGTEESWCSALHGPLGGLKGCCRTCLDCLWPWLGVHTPRLFLSHILKPWIL